jgi:threonine/homoserine/homoserine lactone efflux protein
MKQILYAVGFIVIIYFAWRFMRKVKDDDTFEKTGQETEHKENKEEYENSNN